MQKFSVLPSEIFLSYWRNRELIYSLAKREVLGRYRGSMIGIFWSFLTPLLMLIVYTFVFGVIFKTRWGGGGDSKIEFALVLFAGLMVFNLFAECITRAPTLIISNVNYVKKIVFPLEILPWVSFLSAIFHMLVSLVVWLIFYLMMFGIPHLTLFWLPVVLIPLMLFVLGLSWTLASLGVYLRDIGQVIGVLTTVLMFLSPIFYPITSLPESYQSLFLLNPLTPIIEQTRDVIIFGKTPNGLGLILATLISTMIAWAGLFWFQKTRKGFADVI